MLILDETAALLHITLRDLVNDVLLVQIICYIYVWNYLRYCGESSDFDVKE
jgi:hypothetical protein